MFNLQLNYRKSLLSFALVPTIITSSGISNGNLANSQQPPSPHQIAQNIPTFRISSLWQRRKRPNTVRSGPNDVCAIAPGYIDTYVLWHDRPLFLWQNLSKNKDVELIVREQGSKKVMWQQTVNTADQKLLYGAPQSLEAGKTYEWQLSETTGWRIFQVMPAEERQKIAAQLQALDQKLKVAKASAEEIAATKADFFLDYPIKHKTEAGTFGAWSDALQSLYEVNNPSPSLVKQRQELVMNLCTPPVRGVGV
jgi:hypothetical protein